MKSKKKLLISLMLLFSICFAFIPSTEVEAAVKLNKKKVTLYVGKSTTLKLKGTTKKAKWTSSNKKIATVSSKGKVKAKKKGTAKITAKVGKKKYTCKVTVRQKNDNNKIEYISDRAVQYDDATDSQFVFFALKTSNQVKVAGSGTATITITNDKNETVYNNTLNFTPNDFGYWTSALQGTRYLCCLKIPNSAILSGKSSTGTLSLKVTLSDGRYFPTSSYNVSTLPTDLKKYVKINMPQTPYVIQNMNELAHEPNTGNPYMTEFTLDNISYSVTESYSGLYNVTITIHGTNTRDDESTEKILWKLKKGNVVIKDSTTYTSKVMLNESFIETINLYNIEEGEYTFEINKYSF